MTETSALSSNSLGRPILVIGGGIAGVTTAVEAAEAGCDVILVEKTPHLGGRVARMYQYFPKLCPPMCGLEINFRRLRDNPRVTLLTLAEVEKISGSSGDYEVTVRISPRFVTEACTLCGACAEACEAERADDFNYGLSKTKAAYQPHGMAYPSRYVIDRVACPDGCQACKQACLYGAIDLEQKVERRSFRVAAVVAATGWAPYDATRIANLGFGKYSNVVTNVLFERLAALDGPTSGRILRPSDSKAPQAVAFVQCAGSRDESHLPYCSAVCCSCRRVTCASSTRTSVCRGWSIRGRATGGSCRPPWVRKMARRQPHAPLRRGLRRGIRLRNRRLPQDGNVRRDRNAPVHLVDVPHPGRRRLGRSHGAGVL